MFSRVGLAFVLVSMRMVVDEASVAVRVCVDNSLCRMIFN